MRDRDWAPTKELLDTVPPTFRAYMFFVDLASSWQDYDDYRREEDGDAASECVVPSGVLIWTGCLRRISC